MSGVFVFSDFFDVWLEEDEIRSNFAIDVTPATTEDSNPNEATLNQVLPQNHGLVGSFGERQHVISCQNYAFGFWCLDPARGQEQPTFEGKPFG